MHIMDLVQIKQRFGIIGDNPELNRSLEIARQVASTDLSVLITGESGVGKEVIPQIIHQNSPRKHGIYIAVNCGAIPEGTIDSELFGHEKGSFTGAMETRKGYFEEADGGTLFLDEVAELPLSTQVRLLRVLQTGEFLKVGSSKVQKTDVRVIAATNINLMNAISIGRFREDLFYRLNTVPIKVPPLRERKEDIHLLFKKFALDFADRYMMPAIRLNSDAVELLESYRWPGNVRQLKSVAEQISVLEHDRQITAEVLRRYLPVDGPDKLPVRAADANANAEYMSDRDIIFKILFQLRKDVDELKSQMEGNEPASHTSQQSLVPSLLINPEDVRDVATFSIQDVNADLIKKALEKHSGKRKAAAEELGISERTLYRKIKELGIE
ncbi:MAG: sigma-54 dependent transcriptional regulator [Bacteroidales bacterium]|nr:sigma-54 dependent transcriptional regulator [Bacteroidales bacterium]MDD4670578.1 sigma-54 dependent transcriptional regulator [Bacteroidales bacterium]